MLKSYCSLCGARFAALRPARSAFFYFFSFVSYRCAVGANPTAQRFSYRVVHRCSSLRKPCTPPARQQFVPAVSLELSPLRSVRCCLCLRCLCRYIPHRYAHRRTPLRSVRRCTPHIVWVPLSALTFVLPPLHYGRNSLTSRRYVLRYAPPPHRSGIASAPTPLPLSTPFRSVAPLPVAIPTISHLERLELHHFFDCIG